MLTSAGYHLDAAGPALQPVEISPSFSTTDNKNTTSGTNVDEASIETTSNSTTNKSPASTLSSSQISPPLSKTKKKKKKIPIVEPAWRGWQIPGECQGEQVHYSLLGVDLRDLKEVDRILDEAGVDRNLPTLFE